MVKDKKGWAWMRALEKRLQGYQRLPSDTLGFAQPLSKALPIKRRDKKKLPNDSLYPEFYKAQQKVDVQLKNILNTNFIGDKAEFGSDDMFNFEKSFDKVKSFNLNRLQVLETDQGHYDPELKVRLEKRCRDLEDVKDIFGATQEMLFVGFVGWGEGCIKQGELKSGQNISAVEGFLYFDTQQKLRYESLGSSLQQFVKQYGRKNKVLYKETITAGGKVINFETQEVFGSAVQKFSKNSNEIISPERLSKDTDLKQAAENFKLSVFNDQLHPKEMHRGSIRRERYAAPLYIKSAEGIKSSQNTNVFMQSIEKIKHFNDEQQKDLVQNSTSQEIIKGKYEKYKGFLIQAGFEKKIVDSFCNLDIPASFERNSKEARYQKEIKEFQEEMRSLEAEKFQKINKGIENNPKLNCFKEKILKLIEDRKELDGELSNVIEIFRKQSHDFFQGTKSTSEEIMNVIPQDIKEAFKSLCEEYSREIKTTKKSCSIKEENEIKKLKHLLNYKVIKYFKHKVAQDLKQDDLDQNHKLILEYLLNALELFLCKVDLADLSEGCPCCLQALDLDEIASALPKLLNASTENTLLSETVSAHSSVSQDPSSDQVQSLNYEAANTVSESVSGLEIAINSIVFNLALLGSTASWRNLKDSLKQRKVISKVSEYYRLVSKKVEIEIEKADDKKKKESLSVLNENLKARLCNLGASKSDNTNNIVGPGFFNGVASLLLEASAFIKYIEAGSTSGALSSLCAGVALPFTAAMSLTQSVFAGWHLRRCAKEAGALRSYSSKKSILLPDTLPKNKSRFRSFFCCKKSQYRAINESQTIPESSFFSQGLKKTSHFLGMKKKVSTANLIGFSLMTVGAVGLSVASFGTLAPIIVPTLFVSFGALLGTGCAVTLVSNNKGYPRYLKPRNKLNEDLHSSVDEKIKKVGHLSSLKKSFKEAKKNVYKKEAFQKKAHYKLWKNWYQFSSALPSIPLLNKIVSLGPNASQKMMHQLKLGREGRCKDNLLDALPAVLIDALDKLYLKKNTVQDAFELEWVAKVLKIDSEELNRNLANMNSLQKFKYQQFLNEETKNKIGEISLALGKISGSLTQDQPEYLKMILEACAVLGLDETVLNHWINSKVQNDFVPHITLMSVLYDGLASLCKINGKSIKYLPGITADFKRYLVSKKMRDDFVSYFEKELYYGIKAYKFFSYFCSVLYKKCTQKDFSIWRTLKHDYHLAALKVNSESEGCANTSCIDQACVINKDEKQKVFEKYFRPKQQPFTQSISVSGSASDLSNPFHSVNELQVSQSDPKKDSVSAVNGSMPKRRGVHALSTQDRQLDDQEKNSASPAVGQGLSREEVVDVAYSVCDAEEEAKMPTVVKSSTDQSSASGAQDVEFSDACGMCDAEEEPEVPTGVKSSVDQSSTSRDSEDENAVSNQQVGSQSTKAMSGQSKSNNQDKVSSNFLNTVDSPIYHTRAVRQPHQDRLNPLKPQSPNTSSENKAKETVFETFLDKLKEENEINSFLVIMANYLMGQSIKDMREREKTCMALALTQMRFKSK